MKIKEKIIGIQGMENVSIFALLAGLAVFVPFLIHVQWITGPIVNAVLILALFLVGLKSALVIASVPSLIALASGFLPMVLAPIVPFIIMSNAIFVITIMYVNDKVKSSQLAYLSASVSAAFFKYLFLELSLNFVLAYFVKGNLASKLTQLFSLTQLYSALSGAAIAFLILKFLRRI